MYYYYYYYYYAKRNRFKKIRSLYIGSLVGLASLFASSWLWLRLVCRLQATTMLLLDPADDRSLFGWLRREPPLVQYCTVQ